MCARHVFSVKKKIQLLTANIIKNFAQPQSIPIAMPLAIAMAMAMAMCWNGNSLWVLCKPQRDAAASKNVRKYSPPPPLTVWGRAGSVGSYTYVCINPIKSQVTQCDKSRCLLF